MFSQKYFAEKAAACKQFMSPWQPGQEHPPPSPVLCLTGRVPANISAKIGSRGFQDVTLDTRYFIMRALPQHFPCFTQISKWAAFHTRPHGLCQQRSGVFKLSPCHTVKHHVHVHVLTRYAFDIKFLIETAVAC